MTIFGIDISNNNGAGIDMGRVKDEGFEFVFAKVSEGRYFRDATWPGYRDAALAAGLAVAGYHYLREGDVEGQAALFLDQLGDPDARCAIMVDFEAGSGGQANFWEFVRAINTHGRQVNLSYEPRWYWQSIGSPDLGDLPGLIQSSYVSGRGYATALYPGDDSPYWTGFGGDTVDILQFTDAAVVAGHSPIDANAFRGSRADLDRLLNTALAVPTPHRPEDIMADWQNETVPTQYNAAGDLVLPDGSNGPNAQMPVWQLLSWLDGRVARAEGALSQVNAKLDQLLSAKA